MKAFDKVNHSILMKKLQLLGIGNPLLSWLNEFLKNRKIQVSVQGFISHSRDMVSGVPQGSVLGPILFLIYINHLTADLTCKWSFFADDLKIFISSTADNYNINMELLQSHIDMIMNIAHSWGLNFASHMCSDQVFQAS